MKWPQEVKEFPDISKLNKGRTQFYLILNRSRFFFIFIRDSGVYNYIHKDLNLKEI